MKILKKFIPWAKTEKKSAQADEIESFLFGNQSSFNAKVDAGEAYDLYESVAPLATVVDRIVDSARSVWPVITDGDETITTHPILDLLDNPGFGQTYEEFVRDYATSLLLTGNAYINVIGSPDRPPAAMQVVMPFNVSIDAGDDGYAETYNVTLGRGGQVTYKRTVKNGRWRYLDENTRELLHQKGLTDREGLYGASPLSSIRLELEQRRACGIHNLAFINNGARLSGILNATSQLEDSQYQRLVSKLQSNHQGAENAGEIMVIAGTPIDFKELSTSPRDMDYANLIKESESVTAKRYNVPLPLISGENMTYSNMQTSELAFWNNAVLQLVNSIFSTWSRCLMPRYGMNGYFLHADKSSIEPLKLSNVEAAKVMQATGVFTDNEIRNEMGYEAYPQGNSIYKPAQLIPVGQDTEDDKLPLVDREGSEENEVEDEDTEESEDLNNGENNGNAS